MRILVIHQFYTTDAEAGIPRFNILAKRWRERGAQVTVLTGSVNYITGARRKTKSLFSIETDEKNGARIMRVFTTALGMGYRTFPGRMASYCSFFLSALLSSFFLPRPDLVIASSPPISIGFLGYCIALFRRVPFVFEVRDLWPDEIVELGYIKNRLLIGASRALERFLYARAVRIVVNSPGLKEFLEKNKSVGAEKIAVVVNPSSAKESGKAAPSGIAWGKENVLYIGSHSFVYDFETVLDAAKELPETTFVFVGSGRQKEAMEKKAKREMITNALFYPSVPHAAVQGIIAEADAGIVPLGRMKLLRYIYASKTFDYMAEGKPIIFLGEGVNRVLVCEEAQCGVCAPSGDKEAIKQAIRSLFGNKGKMKEMGESGQRYLAAHFSANAQGDEYLSLLETIVRR